MGFIYDWHPRPRRGIMVTSFIFQGGSGFALTIYYQPTVMEAFQSVRDILMNVNLGWFIKSIHMASYLLVASSLNG